MNPQEFDRIMDERALIGMVQGRYGRGYSATDNNMG